MATNFNDSTPSAAAGGVNVKWQTDGSGNVSAYVPSAATAGGVLVETGNYNAQASDSGKLITFNSASAYTYTLLATAPASPWWVIVKNINTGVATVAYNTNTIDGKSSNVVLAQGDSVAIYSDGTHYYTGLPRTISIAAYSPGVGVNNAILAYLKMDRTCIFPASAPNSYAVANTAATGSTTFTLKKNGSSFCTIVFSSSGTTGAFTQASDAVFAAGDVFEIDGPATADASLANIGITLQGYRF